MRWAGIGAAIVAATVDVLYLGYIGRQGAGDPEFLRVPFVAAFIALMAILAAVSTRASAARWRAALLGVSAAGLLLLGFFAMFSIGLPLLAAGLLALLGLIRTLATPAPSGGTPGRLAASGMAAGGAVVAVVMLLAGFSLTEFAIRCPAKGQMGGGGVTMLGGSYSYSCDDGRLTISR